MKKFNGFLNISIFYAFFLIALGTLLIVYPTASVQIISYTLAIVLILSGLYLVVMNISKLLNTSLLLLGLFNIIIGEIIILYPDSLMIIFPIVLGIWIITNSVFRIQASIMLRNVSFKKWWAILLLSIIGIITGILLIANPKVGSVAITTTIGIFLIIYAVFDLIDLFVIKKNLKLIKKELE